MSKIEEMVNGLTEKQREVMAADDIGQAAHTAHPSTRDGLIDRGLIEMVKREKDNGHEAALTDLGSDVRGALLSAKKETGSIHTTLAVPKEGDESVACLLGLPGAQGLKDLAADIGIVVEPVGLRGLTHDDVVLDEDLFAACFDEGALTCCPLINEKTIVEAACQAAAHAAYSVIVAAEQDVSLLAELTQPRVEALWAAQAGKKEPLPVETAFRTIIPDAGARWPTCPKWLKAWLSVFCATIVAMEPLVEQERADLAGRVEAIKRMRGEEKAKAKTAAKVRARADRLKARMRARAKAPPIRKA